MMRAMLTAAVLLTAMSAGADREIVGIRLWPATSIEPATVLVQIDVGRNAANRLLRVSADSGEFFWSSERQLEGDSSPRTTSFTCRQLPAGEYEVQAHVFGADGRTRGVARHRLMILPR
jgi:hypothetical protein